MMTENYPALHRGQYCSPIERAVVFPSKSGETTGGEEIMRWIGILAGVLAVFERQRS